MFEKVQNAVKAGIQAAKSADIGTVGKWAAGGLLLVASTALTVAGMNAGKGDAEYYDVQSGEADGTEALQEPEEVSTEEDEK